MFRLAPLVCLLLPAIIQAKEPFRFPAAKSGKAELKYVNHVPVLIVEGDPADLGAGVGALALKPARRILDYPRQLLDSHGAGALWPAMLLAGKGMFRQFPDEYARELEAMHKAAGADRDKCIAGNTFFDVKKSLACSAVLIDRKKSATGAPLFARNLDYPSMGYVHEYSLVTVYRPKGKLAFASIGFPGLVGVVSGMNEAGVALGVLEVFDVKEGETSFDARGVAYALCLRRVLEKARTIDEAVKVLEGMRRTTCINVAIADKTGVAVLEITPKRIVRRRATRGVCAATNHFTSKQLAPDEPLDVDGSSQRKSSLERIREWKKKVSVEDLRKELHEVNLGEVTLQTMAFEPATLKLHLSVGKVPATKGTLRALELRELFGGAKDVADRR
jgi:isopenicillin-N N-acyltransferase like protein